MQRAVVIGGSVGGLFAGLAVARKGWSVDIVERDPLPEVDDVESAFRCHPRPAVPQAGHSHNLFAAVVATLRAHAPEVLDDFADAGIRQLRVRDNPPIPLAAALAGPGDEELVGLAARRSTFEWSLRRHVHALPNVTPHAAAVEGLTAIDGPVPRVTGVRLAGGGTADADLVIDASGRRSRSASWIAALGGREVPWDVNECGATYYTRYYQRRAPDEPWPPLNRGVAAGVQVQAYYAMALPADRDTFSITLAVPSFVPELRALREIAVFDALVAATPLIALWGDPAFAVPTTAVRVIAGFVNAARRGVVDAPYAHGFAVLGDAFMHTDPTFARGISVAARSAFALAAILAECEEPADRDLQWRAYLAAEVLTRHDDVVARNSERTASWRAVWAGDSPAHAPFAGDLSWADVGRASVVDVDVWRAMTRYMHVLERFDEAMTPGILARVRELRDEDVLPTFPAGPSPDDVRRLMAPHRLVTS